MTINEDARGFTFDRLSEVNAQRADRWHHGFPHETGPNAWVGSDWSNAMQGEAGEAGNKVKKLRRIETGLQGNRGSESHESLRGELAEEIADTMIYLDLLATYYDIDLPAAVIRKFNEVSDREDFPERLP